MAGNGYLEVRCRNAVLNGEFGKGGRFGSAVPEPNSAWLPWQCCVCCTELSLLPLPWGFSRALAFSLGGRRQCPGILPQVGIFETLGNHW